MSIAIKLVLAFGCIASIMGGLAKADEVDQSTRDGMQQVITRQLDAFAHDDAVAAESFAAPGIKSMYPNPKDFVAMVHQSYAPLVSPRSTSFQKSGTTAMGPMQTMGIVDKDGVPWTALYTFEQTEGQWRITGCVLVKAEGTNV